MRPISARTKPTTSSRLTCRGPSKAVWRACTSSTSTWCIDPAVRPGAPRHRLSRPPRSRQRNHPRAAASPFERHTRSAEAAIARARQAGAHCAASNRGQSVAYATRYGGDFMATKRKPVDAVVIGVGWAGSILGKELAQSGLKVVGLERGGERDQQDFTLPMVHDQLKYDRHLDLFENLSRTTLTFRNNENEVARPLRRPGPFPCGDGVGGAGFHWAGWTWRHTPWDFKMKSNT